MATCPTCRLHHPDGTKTCTADGDVLLPDDAFASVDPEILGEVVGEYRLESRLGEGGFGSVYRAVHTVIGKVAAVKILHRSYSSNPLVVSRFIEEARAVNQIRHKNIIDIFAFGRIPDGRHYFVMELLEGETLEELLTREGRLGLDEAVPIFRAVARALGAAHAQGIAHRDLKPDNIFLARDDDGQVSIKLLDFGIAKLMGEAAPGHKTKTGSPIGTPPYMSPEQCRGLPVDVTTDVYSFGVLVYRGLTGQLVFDAATSLDLMVKHIRDVPAAPSSILLDLHAAFDAPILAMLEKDPGSRPPSAEAGLEALLVAGRSAGLSIAPSHRAANLGSKSARVASPGSLAFHHTSAPTQAFVEARTIAVKDAEHRTFVGSGRDVEAPRTKRRWRTAIAAGLAVLLVGGTTAGLARWAASHDRSARAGDAEGLSRPAEVVPLPTSEPMATGVVSAPAERATERPRPDEVEIVIAGAPPNGVLFLGKERLGPANQAARLAFRSTAVQLTLVVPGFQPAGIDVVPDAPKTLAMPSLRPQRRREYENPY